MLLLYVHAFFIVDRPIQDFHRLCRASQSLDPTYLIARIFITLTATGPWSAWSMNGPVGDSFLTQLLPVGCFNSTFSWMSWPFSSAFTMTAFLVFSPLSSNLAARNVAVSVCHSPGFLQA